MSVARKIKINYNLEAIEAACKKLGLTVAKNIKANLIYGASHISGDVDIAINDKGVFLLGMRKLQNGNTEVVIDNYEKQAPKLLSNILVEYVRAKVYPAFMVDTINQTEYDIVINLKR